MSTMYDALLVCDCMRVCVLVRVSVFGSKTASVQGNRGHTTQMDGRYSTGQLTGVRASSSKHCSSKCSFPQHRTKKGAAFYTGLLSAQKKTHRTKHCLLCFRTQPSSLTST